MSGDVWMVVEVVVVLLVQAMMIVMIKLSSKIKQSTRR